MKKIIISILILICGTVSASKGVENTILPLKENKNNCNHSIDDVCRMSCSTTVQVGGNTLTITSSAGNIFTSCESAALKCTEKLMHKMIDLTFNPE